MSILFSPTGTLNVARDPSDLPEQADKYDIQSGAMVSCKNLRLNQVGKAVTRDGTFKLNSTTISAPSWIEVQSGVRYAFSGSIYENESSIASGLTNDQWSAIQYNAFNDSTPTIFALNGTDTKRIAGGAVYEWGIEAPSTAPVLSVGSATGLTGTYNCKYTYVRKVGSVVVAESNPSPAGNAMALTDDKLTVTITEPTDSQVTHIRLYRTLTDGVIYYYDQEIAIGVGTFTSSASDSALGDEVEEDHDRPPAGSFVFGPAYDGSCFILSGNLLYYCKAKRPEYWPALYYIELGQPQFPLQTGVFHNGQVYVLSKNEIYYVQGTGAGTFFPLPMRAKTGSQSIHGAVSVTGKGIFHTGPDGIYLFSSGTDSKITEDAFEPIFRGESVGDVPAVGDISTSQLKVFRNHLYFWYAAAGSDYPDNVLVMNLETGRTAHYTYGFEVKAVVEDTQNSRFLVGDTSGYVRVIEDPQYTDDDGEQIEFAIQSKDYVLSTRRHWPRWVQYDVDASNTESCTGKYLLGGSVLQTHEITGNRDTRRRLIGTGNGNRAAIRIEGSGPVSIYMAEAE